MGLNISTELGNREEAAKERAQQLTDEAQIVAETLWGIERFGRTIADSPPPIYTDLAWQLQNDKRLLDVLKNALDAMGD